MVKREVRENRRGESETDGIELGRPINTPSLLPSIVLDPLSSSSCYERRRNRLAEGGEGRRRRYIRETSLPLAFGTQGCQKEGHYFV